MSTSASAFEAQDKIQTAMKEMVNELDKSRLRKIQLRMHQCAVKCCQNDSTSLEQTQRCVEECSVPVQSAHNFVQHEIGQFQERLQRCVLDCQDKAKDKISMDSSDSTVESTKSEFESCAIRCVNDHLKLLPNLVKKIQKGIDSMKT